MREFAQFSKFSSKLGRNRASVEKPLRFPDFFDVKTAVFAHKLDLRPVEHQLSAVWKLQGRHEPRPSVRGSDPEDVINGFSSLRRSWSTAGR